MIHTTVTKNDFVKSLDFIKWENDGGNTANTV